MTSSAHAAHGEDRMRVRRRCDDHSWQSQGKGAEVVDGYVLAGRVLHEGTPVITHWWLDSGPGPDAAQVMPFHSIDPPPVAEQRRAITAPLPVSFEDRPGVLPTGIAVAVTPETIS